MFNTVTIHANDQSFWHNRHKKWKQKGVEGVSSLQLTQHENLAKTTIYQNNNSEELFLNSNDRVSVVVDLSISKQTDAHWAIWWHFIKINENWAILHSQSFEVCISNSCGGGSLWWSSLGVGWCWLCWAALVNLFNAGQVRLSHSAQHFTD